MLLFFITPAVLSQTCDSVKECNCALNDRSPAGIMLAHEHSKGVWKFSYRYMNMAMNGNLLGTQKVDDNFVFNNYIMSPQNMRMDMHMLMAMYGITNRLSVMAMFNYNVLDMNMSMLPTTLHVHGAGTTSAKSTHVMNTKTSGLGDIQLYAVYSLLNKSDQLLLLNGGVNIPTGNIYNKGNSSDLMYPSQQLPYMMQMGSGTVDFMPGLTYLMLVNKFSWSTQVTSVIRPFMNTRNYRLGNEGTLNIWAAYQWFNWLSTSLRLEGIAKGEIVTKDAALSTVMEPSANAKNYGGKNINSYIGVNFYLNKGFLENSKLSMEYGMPLYQNINGIQLAQKSTIYAGWMISF